MGNRSKTDIMISAFDAEPPPAERYERLPGLYRRWELEQLLEPSADFRFENAGEMSDGTPLFAAYRARSIARSHTKTQQRKG
jgi:hypothetical protein